MEVPIVADASETMNMLAAEVTKVKYFLPFRSPWWGALKRKMQENVLLMVIPGINTNISVATLLVK